MDHKPPQIREIEFPSGLRVAIQARGMYWHLLTPQEAAQIGEEWANAYASDTPVREVRDLVRTEEHEVGGTVWVTIRGEGAGKFWLTPQEAARVGEYWMLRYGRRNCSPRMKMSPLPE